MLSAFPPSSCVYLFDVLCKFLLQCSTNYLRKCTQLLITSSNNPTNLFLFPFPLRTRRQRREGGAFHFPALFSAFISIWDCKLVVLLWVNATEHKKIHLNKSIFTFKRTQKSLWLRIVRTRFSFSSWGQFLFTVNFNLRAGAEALQYGLALKRIISTKIFSSSFFHLIFKSFSLLPYSFSRSLFKFQLQDFFSIHLRVVRSWMNIIEFYY